MINARHPDIASWTGFFVNRLNRATTNALFAHSAEVAYTQVLVLGLDGQVGDVSIDRVDAQTRALVGRDQQSMITNCTQSSDFRQVRVIGQAAESGAWVGSESAASYLVAIHVRLSC
jgi:hypothetical protein